MCFVCHTKAQITYFNYLDTTAEWRNYATAFNGISGGDTYYSTIYFDGDTLVNNNYYYKQYTLILDSSTSFSGPSVTTQLFGPTLIREDSSLKFWQYYNGADHLLYDWKIVTHLQIGDTFPVPGANCLVQTIDSLLLLGRYLKQYHSSPTGLPNSLLEGVGQLGPICALGVEGNNYTACFTKQGHSLQFSSLSCSLFPNPQRHNGATNIGKYKNTLLFALYPNPASTLLTIETNTQNPELKITDAVGNELISTTQIQIDVSNLQNGVYFVQLKTNDGCTVKKIVIQK